MSTLSSRRRLAAVIVSLCVGFGCDVDVDETPPSVDETPTEASLARNGQVLLGEFVGSFDPTTGTFDIDMLAPDDWSTPRRVDEEGLRTVRQPLYCELPESGGDPNTFSISTVANSIYYTTRECGIAGDNPISDALGAFCATAAVTNHYGVTVNYVTAVLTWFDPPSMGAYAYPLGTASDPNAMPAGPGRPSGLDPIFTHGSPAPGESLAKQWTFPGITGYFSFRGILVGSFPELVNGLDDNCDGRIDDRLRLYADGTPCWVDIDCASGVCTNIDEDTGYGVCAGTCPDGTFGLTCEPCPGGVGLSQCDGHGTCDDGAGGTGVCVCEPGSGFVVGPSGSCDVCAPGYFETGGGCAECPTCYNGGVCVAVGADAGTCSCPDLAHDVYCEETCGDGIQNGDEEGIDCGGLTCVACGGCSSCHGSGDNYAPPVAVDGAVDQSDIGVGGHQAHLTDGPLARAFDCNVCHVVPDDVADPGHLDGVPGAEVTFSSFARIGGANPDWTQTTRRCDNVYCHGATLASGFNPSPLWTGPAGSQTICGSCHGVPPAEPHPNNTDCFVCHSETISPTFDINLDTHVNGVVDLSAGGACDGCHGAPPATGSHLAHFGGGVGDAAYGDTRTAAELRPEGDAYVFGCGNCHPTDPDSHMNGVVNAGGGNAEIDFSAAGAPDGSIKTLHGAGATYVPGSDILTDAEGLLYTQGTCSEVYCHSEMVVLGAPDGVPAPGVDFPFTAYPIEYPPYAVDVERQYSTPTWGVDSLGCDGCHGYTPRTFATEGVVAGEGDSHSWIDLDGYENLHGWAMGQPPLECMTCHSDTVVDPGVVTRTSEPPANQWAVYSEVPIFDFTNHVNGQPDVLFRADPRVVVVDGWFGPTTYTYDLSTAAYDPSTRTCTNVACHKEQTSVEWGQPYRYQNSPECNQCHRY